MWRIAYADGKLDPYEDHYVRKIAHLLYVPNTECMLARGRAAKEK
ncbi:MAG: TerB family tellurite resistance protein [Betaproteobacteria bacterium]